MLKLGLDKLAGLKTFDDHLKEKYGDDNSLERKESEAKTKAWYYAEILKDERKRQNMTQKVLAEKIGKKREYISTLEKGDADMQLSTFLRIADALGLRFSLVLG
ncbi:MAG: helix-turn-helix transcriptional regulator [Prevotella sp.]|nr:helix-turn-helix transcriptional regulator [Prevotella sp.]